MHRTAVAGRLALAARAAVRDDRRSRHLLPFLGAEALEVVADAERGALLRLAALDGDRPFWSLEFEAIEFDESRYVGARSKVLSTTKLRRLVPDIALTPLERGLAATIRWFELETRALSPASVATPTS